MPKTIEKPTILARDVDKVDPRTFRSNTIDPLAIYGVREAVERGISGGSMTLQDHPDFPNPRATVRPDLIADIQEAGALDTPVSLYWTSDGEIIPADGKSRLTAIVKDLVENPDSENWRRIPYVRVRAVDPNDVRIFMVKTNMEDSRAPLTDFEVGAAIDRLEQNGVDEGYIATALNKLGRGGVQYIRKLKDVFNANPAVVEAFRKGEIDLTTASQIVRRVDFADQKETVAKVQEAQAQGLSAPAARKAVGVKGPNRTTLGFNETLEYLVENIFVAFRQILEKESDDPDYEAKINWADRSQRQDYASELIVRTAFDMSMRHLRKDDLSLADQLKWVEETMREDQKVLLRGLRPIKSLKVLS
jgi:hypothetical protein